MNLEPRTIEILAQVVYKELSKSDGVEKVNHSDPQARKDFFEDVKEDTLELARTILRVSQIINPTK